jgi:hypothetical protein
MGSGRSNAFSPADTTGEVWEVGMQRVLDVPRVQQEAWAHWQRVNNSVPV